MEQLNNILRCMILMRIFLTTPHITTWSAQIKVIVIVRLAHALALMDIVDLLAKERLVQLQMELFALVMERAPQLDNWLTKIMEIFITCGTKTLLSAVNATAATAALTALNEFANMVLTRFTTTTTPISDTQISLMKYSVLWTF